MKVSQVKILLINIRKKLQASAYRYSAPNESEIIEYQNLFTLIESFLSEHHEFIKRAYYNKGSREEMISSLNYLEIILDMKLEEIKDKDKEKPKNFLDSAQDKLKQAGLSFDNKDYSGVSNKLNTAVELAIKDALDIPSTINGINTSKILDILISNKLGPVEYLREVKKHVLMDNLVKHQGMSPIESRAVTAIAAVENLFKKLKEPVNISEEIKDKIWSGVE
jgi:HEPN domain-containing protein